MVHYTSAMVLLCFNLDFAQRFGYFYSQRWRSMITLVLVIDTAIMKVQGASFWSLLTVVLSSQALPLLCFGPHFDRDTWIRFGKYVVASFVVLTLIANEVLNCETMLQSGSYSPYLPPHAAVELAGFVALKWLAEFICQAKPISAVSRQDRSHSKSFIDCINA